MKAPAKSNRPDTSYAIEDQIITSVAEHQIFFSFNSDQGAELFRDWWVREGEAAFDAWVDAEKHDRW